MAVWTFLSIVNTEQALSGRWYATCKFSVDGAERVEFLKFQSEPTQAEIQSQAEKMAVERSLDDVITSRIISKQEFVSRFTINEIGAIYSASQTNQSLLGYVKKLEMYNTVDLDSPDVAQGLDALEMIGVIGQGRSVEIRS